MTMSGHLGAQLGFDLPFFVAGVILSALVSAVLPLRSGGAKERAADQPQSAVCIMDRAQPVQGTVTMRAHGAHQTRFECALRNLAPGLHGMHVHKAGDLRDGCASACDHYNPSGAAHGGPTGPNRHRGDLGNIRADEDRTCTSVVVADVTIREILGRSLIVHADEDDLGRGEHPLSSSTGNAGARIGCGVIGLVPP